MKKKRTRKYTAPSIISKEEEINVIWVFRMSKNNSVKAISEALSLSFHAVDRTINNYLKTLKNG